MWHISLLRRIVLALAKIPSQRNMLRVRRPVSQRYRNHHQGQLGLRRGGRAMEPKTARETGRGRKNSRFRSLAKIEGLAAAKSQKSLRRPLEPVTENPYVKDLIEAFRLGVS